MKTHKTWLAKIVAAAFVAALFSSNLSSANAADVTTDPNYAALETAITSTSSALSAATSVEIQGLGILPAPDGGMSKQVITAIVTPTVSETSQYFFTSVDSQVTWQLQPQQTDQVFQINDTVYAKLNANQVWSNDYSDFSNDELKAFLPFKAEFVSAPISQLGIDGNDNIALPSDRRAQLSQFLSTMLISYTQVATTLTPIVITTDADSNTVYSLDAAGSAGGTMTLNFVVNSVSGLVQSFGYTYVQDTLRDTVNFTVKIGSDAVTPPVFNPSSTRSIAQVDLLKRVDGLTAQTLLYGTANKIVTVTKTTAKKTRAKVTSALIFKIATKIVGKAKVKAVTGGARIAGSYNKQAGYLCVVAKSNVPVIKTCR
jgi:hypothetical protein